VSFEKVVCVIVTAGFDALRDELGSSRASSVHQGLSLDHDEQDMVKVSIRVSFINYYINGSASSYL